MPDFKQDKKAKTKPDKKGRVLVKIILIDEAMLEHNASSYFPVSGNLKEQLILTDTTVGDVFEAVRSGLGLVSDEELSKEP